MPSINFLAIPCSAVSRMLRPLLSARFSGAKIRQEIFQNSSVGFSLFSLSVIEGSFVSSFETDGCEWARDAEALLTASKEIHVLPNSSETGLTGKAELADWLSPGQAAAELFLR